MTPRKQQDELLKFDKRIQAGRVNIRDGMSAKEFQEAVTQESDLQRQVIELLCWKYPDIRYIRIPDWAYTKLATSRDPALKKFAEILRGLPDTIIFKKAEVFNLALLLELKSKTGKLRQGQINWAESLNLDVKRDFESVEKLIDEFMEG